MADKVREDSPCGKAIKNMQQGGNLNNNKKRYLNYGPTDSYVIESDKLESGNMNISRQDNDNENVISLNFNNILDNTETEIPSNIFRS